MAPRKSKLAAGSVKTRQDRLNGLLFDDFLPHLIARLAYRLNGRSRREIAAARASMSRRWRMLAVLSMG